MRCGFLRVPPATRPEDCTAEWGRAAARDVVWDDAQTTGTPGCFLDDAGAAEAAEGYLHELGARAPRARRVALFVWERGQPERAFLVTLRREAAGYVTQDVTGCERLPGLLAADPVVHPPEMRA